MVAIQIGSFHFGQELHINQLRLNRTHGDGVKGERPTTGKVMRHVAGRHDLDNVLDTNAEFTLLVESRL